MATIDVGPAATNRASAPPQMNEIIKKVGGWDGKSWLFRGRVRRTVTLDLLNSFIST